MKPLLHFFECKWLVHFATSVLERSQSFKKSQCGTHFVQFATHNINYWIKKNKCSYYINRWNSILQFNTQFSNNSLICRPRPIFLKENLSLKKYTYHLHFTIIRWLFCGGVFLDTLTTPNPSSLRKLLKAEKKGSVVSLSYHSVQNMSPPNITCYVS